MSSEFDWFMITMPVFALAVYAIVMVGSLEKQPKFLESKQTDKGVIYGFGFLFLIGILYSGYAMVALFFELLSKY